MRKDELPYIEVGGDRYPIDASKVSFGDWVKMINYSAAGDNVRGGPQLMKIIQKAMAPKVNSMPVTYLPVIVPRVMEILAAAITPSNMDEELGEILGQEREDDPEG